MRIVMLAPFGIHPKGTVLSRTLPLGYALAKKGNEVVLVIPQEEDVSITTNVSRGSLRLLNVPTGPRGYAIDDLVVSYEMMRKTSSLEPEIIHVFKPKGYGGLAGMLKWAGDILRNEKKPLVLDGDDHEGFGGMNDVIPYPGAWKLFFHFQERLLPRICDRMTLASTYLMDYYSSFGAERENMIHLPNGVNPFIHFPGNIDEGLEEFVSKRHMGMEELKGMKNEGSNAFTNGNIKDQVPEETISLFSRFRDHGTERVLKIFRAVQNLDRRAKFLLAGDWAGNETVRLRKGMKKYLKEGSFQFTGTFPFTSMQEVFSHSNIAMVPVDDSNITRAKCSAKLVDLMAMGKAVVADNIGENGNYIEDGVTGCLVDNIVGAGIPEKDDHHIRDNEKENLKEFSERLIYLLDNPMEANELGREARKRVNSEFSWRKLARGVADLYHQLV